MGSMTPNTPGINGPVGGTAGVLAARNRALNTPMGQGAPGISDLVRGVGNNLNQVGGLQGPAPMNPLGALMNASSVNPALATRDAILSGGAPQGTNIADIIRQIRMMQGG